MRSSQESSLSGRLVPLGAGHLVTPAYFASISSLKSRGDTRSYLQILAASGYPDILVSAYDVARAEEPEGLRELIRRHQQLGGRTLLDSGGYEAFWLDDRTWDSVRHDSVLTSLPWTLATSFDLLGTDDEPEWRARAVAAVREARDAASSTTVAVPIVHGPTPGVLIDRCSWIARETGAWMMAVPERELGDGLIARRDSVRRLRAQLDDTCGGVALHLLGTGAPLSIAAYVECGADTFDGLEWCRTAVEPTTGRLVPFHHLDLVLQREIPGLGKSVSLMLQNLEFYAAFMVGLRMAGGGIAEWLATAFPGGIGDDLHRLHRMEAA